jgi:hypothetical protein
MGEKLMERGFELDLLLDWDLDLDVLRRHTDRAIAHGRKPLKLVHLLDAEGHPVRQAGGGGTGIRHKPVRA